VVVVEGIPGFSGGRRFESHHFFSGSALWGGVPADCNGLIVMQW
jgi:hypothetical protein